MKTELDWYSRWVLFSACSVGVSLHGSEAFLVTTNQGHAAQLHYGVVCSSSSTIGNINSGTLAARIRASCTAREPSKSASMDLISFGHIRAQRRISKLHVTSMGSTYYDDPSLLQNVGLRGDRPRDYRHTPCVNTRQRRRRRRSHPPLFSEDQGWMEALKEMSGESSLPMGPKKKVT